MGSDVMENPLSLPQNNKVIKTEKKKSKGKKEKKKRKEKRKDGEEISRTNKRKKDHCRRCQQKRLISVPIQPRRKLSILHGSSVIFSYIRFTYGDRHLLPLSYCILLRSKNYDTMSKLKNKLCIKLKY